MKDLVALSAIDMALLRSFSRWFMVATRVICKAEADQKRNSKRHGAAALQDADATNCAPLLQRGLGVRQSRRFCRYHLHFSFFNLQFRPAPLVLLPC
jgi:hypothetical protein